MITIGNINFNLGKQYITDVSRKTSVNYAELKKLNSKAVLQYTGQSADTLSLNCEITSSSSDDDLVSLRELTVSAKPQLLQDSKGMLGEFVIISINEKLQKITRDGAKVIKFDMELKKYER